MAAEQNSNIRGVVVEFDFAVLDGAEILFQTTKRRLEDAGVELTPKTEALHMIGNNLQAAFADIFNANKKKHDPAKAARELLESFSKRVTDAYATAMTPGIKAFVDALAAKGVHVVFSTRGNAEALRAELEKAGCAANAFSVHFDISTVYGNCRWDGWNRACESANLRKVLSAAVTGSGAGVKEALKAGLSVMAVPKPRTEWQDFGGADAFVDSLNAAAATTLLAMIHAV